MARRKGMMVGKGKKGYHNVTGKDPMVHSQSAKGIKQPQRINIMRVPYGNAKTPIHLREYQMGFGQPVGTIKEFEDFFKGKDVKLNVDMTMAEKKQITKKSKLKDTDKDGVGDVLDCDPKDPTKQDLKESYQKVKQFTKEKVVPFAKKEYGVAKEFTKKKLEERREKQELRKEESLRKIDHPLLTKLDRQKDRVNELISQHNTEDDIKIKEKLDKELDKEQEQLTQIQEDVTKLDMADLSDAQIKELAIKIPKSFFSLGSGNKYEDELVRRIKKRAEIGRSEAKINNEDEIARAKLNKKLAEEKKKALEKPDSGIFDIF